MRLFTMYRRAVPALTHDENQRNAPDEPQFQGVVFDDGRVSVRWLTAKRSVSVWDSMDDMLAIHGHPEYGSELVWHDALASSATATPAVNAIQDGPTPTDYLIGEIGSGRVRVYNYTGRPIRIALDFVPTDETASKT